MEGAARRNEARCRSSSTGCGRNWDEAH
jgi:hypothetical protein